MKPKRTERFMEDRSTFRVGKLPNAKRRGWLLGLDGQWCACSVQLAGDGPSLSLADVTGGNERGTSGSPILATDGLTDQIIAVGIIAIGTLTEPYLEAYLEPYLEADLPGWLSASVFAETPVPLRSLAPSIRHLEKAQQSIEDAAFDLRLGDHEEFLGLLETARQRLIDLRALMIQGEGEA